MIINSVISGGGGEQPTSDYTVKVIDYDGTVLLETKGKTGDAITLPTAPTHDKLVFQEWSASVSVTNNTVTIEDNDVMVGAVYTTASGKSEFDITLTKVTGLSVTLNMNGTKDWGDGTSDTATTHTYTAYGDYTITCDGTTMTTSNSSALFGQGSSAKNYYCIRARLAKVTSISIYAFHYCYSLVNIIFPNGITKIDNRAFEHCYSLTNVTIPSSVTSIGESAFYSCSSLTNVTIPSSITSIANYMFGNCYSLTNVTIPSSVTSIGNYAFNSCYTLENVKIPSSITSIGGNAFSGCYSLTNITIPSSVTRLVEGVFSSCYSLANVTIPNSVTSISAFGNCYSLTNVTIPSSVTSIGGFSGCYSLKNITIPNSVTRIGGFIRCYSLTEMTMPNSVTEVASQAFYDCPSITKYDFSQHTSVPTLSNADAFKSINGLCKIIVPDSLYDSWIAATNWSTYANYIYKASEVNGGGASNVVTDANGNTLQDSNGNNLEFTEA